ncbi:MAG TPA: hypothetical protein VFA83_04485 [Acidimicrobiales bacterium]|nr:hypothetical protein [Acidimicrobiales bacterium]
MDELWRATPDEFVAVRNQLAKQLKAEGKTDEAETVKKLKKPSVAVWAVNRLARERPSVVEDLVELGRQVEAATADAMKGEGAGALRELDRQRKHAVGDAATAAAAVAAEAGLPLSSAMAGRVTSTLDNASLAQATRDLLAAGRIPTELDAPGFEGLEGLDLGDLGVLRGGSTGADAHADTDVLARERKREEERAAEERRRAEAEAERLEAVAADAEEVARTARARADAARRHADELRAGGAGDR